MSKITSYCTLLITTPSRPKPFSHIIIAPTTTPVAWCRALSRITTAMRLRYDDTIRLIPRLHDEASSTSWLDKRFTMKPAS